MISRYQILCLVVVFVLFVFGGEAFSKGNGMINLAVDESTVRGCGKDTWLVSIGNPAIADVELKNVGQRRYVLITARRAGATNIVVCKGEGDCTVAFSLKVWDDIDPCKLLKKKLKEILPDEDIKVFTAGSSIILSGEVSSTINISVAMEMAEGLICSLSTTTYASGETVDKYRGPLDEEGRASVSKVVNLMQVGGVQQVMLEVRVAEMGRKLMKRLGFNFAFFDGKDFAISLLNNMTSFTEAGGVYTSLAGTTINGLFRFHHGSQSWTGFIDALKGEGVMKILAEPTLITLSGQEAEFLAGGEFPVPEPEELGKVGIEWKQYGVALKFTPRVLSNDKISLKVLPGVSELDHANALTFLGYVIPALTTRYASTTIELDDGQSFAIAGLLSEQVYEDIQKFPILGDIPILGALFRSSEFKKHESELVIIVTPHLVKPLDMTKQTLPTDEYVEPDDFEFYVMGLIEGITREEKRPSGPLQEEGLEGKFGHIAP